VKKEDFGDKNIIRFNANLINDVEFEGKFFKKEFEIVIFRC